MAMAMSPASRAIYNVIRDACERDRDGVATITSNDLARMAGIKQTSVKQIVRRLKAMKLIKVEMTLTPQQGFGPNKYEVIGEPEPEPA